MPKEAKELLITIDELDDGELHPSTKARGTIVMPIVHGQKMKIRSLDSTFKGELVLKLFDYDERKEHSEGLKDFDPHKAKYFLDD